MIGSANDGDRYEQWYRFDVPGTSNTLPTYIEGNPLYSICFPVFIGPESDHWQCLSVTDSLTDSLTL